VRQVFDDLFAVPTVVSAGENLDSHPKKLFGEAWSDAEAGSGVFAIGDAEIDLAVREDIRKALTHDSAAGRADNVTDEQNSHG
jgi:hypothetical protein